MAQGQPPISLAVLPGAEQVIFSDVVVVNGSPTGFVLNFGQWAPEQPGLVRVYTRVGMSPNHLKMLAQLLTGPRARSWTGSTRSWCGDTTSPPGSGPKPCRDREGGRPPEGSWPPGFVTGRADAPHE